MSSIALHFPDVPKSPTGRSFVVLARPPAGVPGTAFWPRTRGALVSQRALEELTDEELIVRSRHREAAEAQDCLAVLYRRYYAKVAGWSLRVCDNVDLASDIAQQVFLRVQDRLDSFRIDSRFSTWLYSVTRRVAINAAIAARRHRTAALDNPDMPEPVSPALDAEQLAAKAQIIERFRAAIDKDLEPMEAEALYLHFVHGMTLNAVTERLELANKSGAKALIVSARRKLHRRFGRWLKAQGPRAEGSESWRTDR